MIPVVNLISDKLPTLVKFSFPLLFFGFPMLSDISLFSKISISLSLTNSRFYMLLIPSSTNFTLISLIALLSMILIIIKINKCHALNVDLLNFI